MRNFYVDFSRLARYTLYPTRFVMKMIFLQLLVTTGLLLLLIIGESYITYKEYKEYKDLQYCDLFPHSLEEYKHTHFTTYFSHLKRNWRH